jgi:hypothetical protein
VTKELAVATRQRTISHFLFNQGIFYQKQHDCRPYTNLTFLFLFLKVKLKHLSDTIEVIETPSQAVLNTLTGYHLQEAFKMAEELGTVHTHEGDNFEGNCGQ